MAMASYGQMYTSGSTSPYHFKKLSKKAFQPPMWLQPPHINYYFLVPIAWICGMTEYFAHLCTPFIPGMRGWSTPSDFKQHAMLMLPMMLGRASVRLWSCGPKAEHSVEQRRTMAGRHRADPSGSDLLHLISLFSDFRGLPCSILGRVFSRSWQISQRSRMARKSCRPDSSQLLLWSGLQRKKSKGPYLWRCRSSLLELHPWPWILLPNLCVWCSITVIIIHLQAYIMYYTYTGVYIYI